MFVINVLLACLKSKFLTSVVSPVSVYCPSKITLGAVTSPLYLNVVLLASLSGRTGLPVIVPVTLPVTFPKMFVHLFLHICLFGVPIFLLLFTWNYITNGLGPATFKLSPM